MALMPPLETHLLPTAPLSFTENFVVKIHLLFENFWYVPSAEEMFSEIAYPNPAEAVFPPAYQSCPMALDLMMW
ncbi:MAG: hypothetical protein ACTH8J_08690 [Specibacter sp.]